MRSADQLGRRCFIPAFGCPVRPVGAIDPVIGTVCRPFHGRGPRFEVILLEPGELDPVPQSVRILVPIVPISARPSRSRSSCSGAMVDAEIISR
jgi:hypothetical protein